jgi:hypothetical protein
MKTDSQDLKKSVFGIFQTQIALEFCVTKLKEKGFFGTDISVLMPSKSETKTFAHENSTKSPEFATGGAAGGAVIGGVLGWLAGIGTLAIPGVGPFIAAGPIVAALSGAGIGGAIGGISGALIGLGVPEYEAKRYESLVNAGGMLLSVHVGTSELQNSALETLKASGASDISVKKESKGTDFNEEDRPLGSDNIAVTRSQSTSVPEMHSPTSSPT